MKVTGSISCQMLPMLPTDLSGVVRIVKGIRQNGTLVGSVNQLCSGPIWVKDSRADIFSLQ